MPINIIIIIIIIIYIIAIAKRTRKAFAYKLSTPCSNISTHCEISTLLFNENSIEDVI
jgi:hypothetical protein